MQVTVNLVALRIGYAKVASSLIAFYFIKYYNKKKHIHSKINIYFRKRIGFYYMTKV